MILAYSHLFRGDGKPHPVETIVGLIIYITAIFCFDKWVIRSEKTHERHYKSDKVLKRERSFWKRHWHSFLQIVEVFVGLYFWRGLRSNDEPFRKATQTEKRVGGCFMTFLPFFFMTVLFKNNLIDKIIDEMTKCHLWAIGLVSICFFAAVSAGLGFRFYIAPKIPLSVSVPFALLNWLLLAWLIWK